MFGALSKLFDRNFVMGYFLPVALFLIAGSALLAGFGLWPSGADSHSFLFAPSTETSPSENTAIGTLAPLVNTTIFAIVVWFCAVFLLAINRFVYRTMEGYGAWNPAQVFPKLFAKREERRYNKLQGKKQSARRSNDERLLRRLMLEEAAQFPPERDQLLPTRFGNTLRAFEYYSWAIYGIDAVVGWNRLWAVIPKDYQDALSEAKAQTDFWLHLWILGFLILIGYMISALYVICCSLAAHLYMLLFFPVVLVVPLLASLGTITAAVAWGDIVKASFDVFLPELGEKLGFPPIRTFEQERHLWWLFASATTRRNMRARKDLVEKLSAGTDLTARVQDLEEQLRSSKAEVDDLRSQLESRRPDAQEERRSWWRRIF